MQKDKYFHPHFSEWSIFTQPVQNGVFCLKFLQHAYFSQSNFWHNFDPKFTFAKNDQIKKNRGSKEYIYTQKSNSKIKINHSVKKQLRAELKYQMDKFSTYIRFKDRVEYSKKKLVGIFSKIKKNKKKIIGYGSTAKSVTILNYCKIKSETLDYFVDTTPDKTKKYMPGTHIYIDKYKKSLLDNVDYIFLGAWNFKDEIFKKEKKFIKKGGKFITHIPIPKII